MAVAELELQADSKDPKSFFFKAIDTGTQMTVVVGSKDKAKQVADALAGPGLYILQAEDTTVYVGQSKELQNRLTSHRNAKKIGFTKVMAMTHGATFLRYLDYAEAKLYQILKDLGYRLEQSPLENSVEAKKFRMGALANSHADEADKIISAFLAYSVAFGLAEPAPPIEQPCVEQALAAPLGGQVSNAEPMVPLTIGQPAARPAAPTAPPRMKLRVTAAGHVPLQEEIVANTFVMAIQLAGPAKVAALNLMMNGEPLVSAGRHQKYPTASKDLGSGYFLSVHSNTSTKLAMLNRISEQLQLNWTCELVA